MRRVAPLVGAAVLAWSSPAAALDTDDLYAEIRDVVEDVIKAEVTGSIARAIEADHPSLCFYFHGALDRMQSSYWGGVPGQLREGVTVMLGDFLYWQLTRDGAGEGVAAAYEAFVGFVAARDEALRGHSAGKGRAHCSTRSWAGERSLVEQHCDGDYFTTEVSDGAAQRHDAACAIARTAVAALRQQPEQASAEMIDFITQKLGGRDHRLFQFAVNGTKDVRELYRDLTSNRTGPLARLDDLTDVCDFRLDLDPESPCWYLDLRDEVEEAQVRIMYSTGETAELPLLELPQVIDRPRQVFEREIADAAPVAEEISRSAWNDMVVRGKRKGGCDRAVEATFRIRDAGDGELAHGRLWFGDDGRTCDRSAVDGLYKVTATWAHWTRRIDELTEQLDDFGFDVTRDGVRPTAQSLAATLGRARQLTLSSDILRGFLTRWTAERRPIESVDELLGVAEKLLREPAIAEIGASPGLDAVIESIRADATFVLIEKLIARRDYRELAVAGLDAVFEQSSHLSEAQERFLVGFSAYVLDGGGGDDSDRAISKEALRAAVRDLVLTSPRGGFPTRASRLGRGVLGYPRFGIRPTVSVRWEFDATGRWLDRSDDGIRRTVSADLLSVDVPVSDYVGLRMSAIDLFGPFTELALRDPDRDYHGSTKTAALLVRPRAELWLGLPQLTRRVAFVAGIAVDFLGREVDADGAVTYDVDPSTPQVSFGGGASIFF